MPTQLNVKDFGATGTGTLDDSPAIQRAIDAAESAPDRADVVFPPGNYRCLSRITLNLSRGGRLIGAGNTFGPPGYGSIGYAGRDVGSTLLWDGEDGGTLLELLASNGATIEGLNLVGTMVPAYKFSTATSPGAPVGQIQLNNTNVTSVTAIYANDATADGIDITWWLDGLDEGGTPRLLTVTDGGHSVVYTVNSVTAASGYRTIAVTFSSQQGSGGFISNGAGIRLDIEKDGVRKRAGVLMQQKSTGGTSTGHYYFQNCHFRDADVGLQLDDVEIGNNCADNTIVHCQFIDCAAGIRARSIQVVNNEVINCEFSACDVGIDQVRGGDLRVFGGSMNGEGQGGVFLKIEGGATNASTFVLSGVRLERAASTGLPALLDAGYSGNNSGEQNILIDGIGWSGGNWNGTDNTVPLLTIGEQCNVTIRGAQIKGKLAAITGSSTRKSTLRVEHCRFVTFTPSQVITTNADGYWKTIDCTDQAGNPIANAESWPIAEFVKLAGRTGGQTINGGTGSGENLTLVSTSDGTKGQVVLGASIFRVDEVNSRARLANFPLQFASGTGTSDDVGIKRSSAGTLQITNASTGFGSLLLGSSASSNPSLTVRAISSQTANLTQWQDSNGKTLLGVTSAAHLTTPDIGVSDTPVAATSLVVNGGTGSNADQGLANDQDGGAGASLALTGGSGGSAYGLQFGGATGGAGGSVKLQAGLGGAITGTGSPGVNGEVVVNDTGAATNFRVESDTNANCLFVAAASDRVGILTNSPTAALDINSDVLRLRTSKTPSSASATGNAGDIAWDSGFLYVCVAANTWKRSSLATWT